MRLYSYQGQEPKELPQRLRLELRTLTDLHSLSISELNDLGFTGPFDIPNIDPSKQKYQWNGEEYVVEDITDEEISKIKSDQEKSKLSSVNTDHLWLLFKSTPFYKRIRKEASVDLKVNILYTELVSNFLSEKSIDTFSERLNPLFFVIKFEVSEIESLKEVLNRFNILENFLIPDEEYISKNLYDFDTDFIVSLSTKPFESWVWDGREWVAPIPRPTKKHPYIWNENTKKWNKV